MKKLSELTTSVKLLLAAGAVSALTGGGILITSAMEADQRIDADQATAIALKDAGVSKSDADINKAVLKKEDGRRVYEVTFTAADQSYDYTIASDDGDILDRDVESLKKSVASTAISLDAAKIVALKDAGLSESQVSFTKSAKEKDDNVQVYDIEFKTDTTEYDYTIGMDGSIMDKSHEKIKTSQSNTKTNNNTSTSGASKKTDTTPSGSSTAGKQNTSALIGVEKAKNLALADAGVSASQATFTKGKLDYDNGQPVYDIEFMTASAEYDYEIDAKSGAVRERSSEYIEQPQQPISAYIGVDRARTIALQHAGLASGEVTFTKTKLENEDGQSVYEIEFRKGMMEYDYTIDAIKGSILDWDQDQDDGD